MLFECPVLECFETFNIPVWHCPVCRHHWPLERATCHNCHSVEFVRTKGGGHLRFPDGVVARELKGVRFRGSLGNDVMEDKCKLR